MTETERYTVGIDEYSEECVELRKDGECIAYFLNDDITHTQIGTVKDLLNKLESEKEYWKKWVIEYLLDYELYSDAFLETLRSIEGDDFVERTKQRQEEIINVLKQEGLYESWSG